MKKIITAFVLYLLISTITVANGVAIVNAETSTYLKLRSSDVLVNVENQVAVITSRQIFKNELNASEKFKFAFPLPEGASATKLSWFINGSWESAIIAAEPQDTSLPGGSGGGATNLNLEEYLGNLPLYFDIPDALPKDSIITIELEYVQLLEYYFGEVSFFYPNDYSLIQTDLISQQNFEFDLISGRTIDNLQMLTHIPQFEQNNGNSANIKLEISESSADMDYKVLYSLSTEEYGLFGFSTKLADSIVYDKKHGSGYFTFVVEPNPKSGSEIIEKVFTLIVDRSGSMGGSKIRQAREAASFIVNNLNDDDKFNIVDFASEVNSFRSEHVVYNEINKANALNYINGFNANGGTNISGALSQAISQYANTGQSTANIIIFFTDGQASAGITGTDEILEHVNSELSKHETAINLFSFGIGTGANQQLLTLLATQNNGLAEFLNNNELESTITQFYLEIQNPVLLGTEISLSSKSITEIYPNPLPSLYKGQQMIVSGRYNEPGVTEITLSGHALGNPVEYKYNLTLSDTTIPKNQFLTKIWAKQKIENLIVKYYGLDNFSVKADSIKEEILTLSIAYGIITEFTSFTENPELTSVEEIESKTNEKILPDEFKLLGNYPNPFNPSTNIRFSVGREFSDAVTIKIFNSIGQLVRVLSIDVNGKGIYEITWDGLTNNGDFAPSDMYIYTLDFGNTILAGKMLLIK